MNRLNHFFVCLRRIGHSRGFGIQSPTDYAFVRYVVNEHWPYYAYEQMKDGDWLQLKLGKLYMRLANWRQPSTMLKDRYQHYWQAGCRKIRFTNTLDRVELARIDIYDADGLERLLQHSDEQSVVVIEDICNDMQRWHAIEHDARVGTTFDLYYCGIVFFDKKRTPHHYIIHF